MPFNKKEGIKNWKKVKTMKKVAIVGLFQVQNHYYKLLLEKHQIRNFKLNI